MKIGSILVIAALITLRSTVQAEVQFDRSRAEHRADLSCYATWSLAGASLQISGQRDRVRAVQAEMVKILGRYKEIPEEDQRRERLRQRSTGEWVKAVEQCARRG